MLRNRLRQPQAKWVLVLLSLVPFAYLCAGVYFDHLGPNPAEFLIRSSGDLTLRFLCITLLITPCQVPWAMPCMIGSRYFPVPLASIALSK